MPRHFALPMPARERYARRVMTLVRAACVLSLIAFVYYLNRLGQ